MLSAKGSGRRYDDNQSSSTDSSSDSSKSNSLSFSLLLALLLCVTNSHRLNVDESSANILVVTLPIIFILSFYNHVT